MNELFMISLAVVLLGTFVYLVWPPKKKQPLPEKEVDRKSMARCSSGKNTRDHILWGDGTYTANEEAFKAAFDAAQASPGREEIENYIHHQISGHLHPETARQIAQRAAQFAAPQPASNAYASGKTSSSYDS